MSYHVVDDGSDVIDVAISPSAEMEAERPVGREESLAHGRHVLPDHLLWIGAQKNVEVEHTPNCPATDRDSHIRK